MSKPTVILADTDDNYLVPLEQKFLEELYDKIELEVITDPAYFEEFFSKPKKAEILVISEDLYHKDLQKHNISNIFVLSEQSDSGGTEDLTITKIFKYTSIKEIYNEVVYKNKTSLAEQDYKNKETTVVVVYSNIGGSGKTTVSIGLASCLAQSHKRVLYINTEVVQSFQYYLSNKEYLSNSACKELKKENNQIYENIKHYIRTEGFSYVPPLCATLMSLNLQFAFYTKLIQAAKRSKDYDFIVVDMDGSLDDDSAELFSLADKTLILTLQDSYSVFKTNCLMNNLDCKDKERFNVVCNKYSASKVNFLISQDRANKLMVDEYIEEYNNEHIRHMCDLLKIDGIQKIAYMLI